ncbi:hypothetical protein A2U01_0080306, partial [Trifolium medium]|nr:hypothetical protein [Trifolium medium]
PWGSVGMRMETNIPPWGWGWKQKLPRKHFGAVNGEASSAHSRPVDIPTSQGG